MQVPEFFIDYLSTHITPENTMGYGIELLTVCFHPKQGRNVIQVGITQPHYCFTVDCNYTFATSVISYEIAQRNSYSLMLIF